MAFPQAAKFITAATAAGRCIPDAAYARPSAANKELALAWYGEGISLSALARRFGVTPVAQPGTAVHGKPGGTPAGCGDCRC